MDKGRQITLAKQTRRDTTPPAATSGPVSVNCQPGQRSLRLKEVKGPLLDHPHTFNTVRSLRSLPIEELQRLSHRSDLVSLNRCTLTALKGSVRIDYSCADPSREIGCTQLLSDVIVHNR